MVEPPKRPEPGTPEYHWLYGESGEPTEDATRKRPLSAQERPAHDEPEATRVMPALGSRARPPATQPGSRPPGGPPPGPPPGGRRPRFPVPRLRWLRWLLLLVVLWIVFLIAVPIIAFQRVTTLDDAFPSGNRPDDQDGTTYLIVGSDAADDLTAEQRRAMRTGPRSAHLTDTIMLLHIGDGPNLLMSIPRDSLVDVPGSGVGKINGAFSRGGPALLVRTIEKNTGIRVDNYVELGFGSVINVVDAIGGVEICPKQRMVDKRARLDIKKGCQEVDGMTALAYSRSRHANKYSDLGRVGQQREVVSAIGSEVVSPWTVLNPWRYWHLSMAGAESVRVSDGTGPIDLARFAWAMTHVDGEDGLTCTVPVADFAVHWDPERSKQMFRYIREDDTEGIPKSLCTKTGLPRSTTG
jgi:LCP family protein required for cell wall assembly